MKRGCVRNGSIFVFLTFLSIFLFDQPIAASPPAQCAPPPSGLVSWWRGEGNANDASGANNGVILGGAGIVSGEVGQAFDLSGSGDYVRVAPPVGLPIGAAPRTMMLWFKTPNTWSSQYALLMQYGGTSPSSKFGLMVPDYSGRRLTFWGEGNDLTGSTVLQPNTWYHGAVTYDGSTVRLYLNGQPEASQAKGLGTFSGSDFTLGRYGSNSNITGEWDGLIDEALVFDRELSAAEIQGIFNAGSAGICSSCTPPPGGMTAWWAGESNAQDSVGGNNGSFLANSYAAGMDGMAFNLNGTGEVVSIPAYDMGTDWTIEGWFDPRSCSDGSHCPLLARSNGNQDGLAVIYLSDAYPTRNNEFALNIGSGTWQVVLDSLKHPRNAWYHVAARKSGDNYTLFVNGVQEGQTTVPGVSTVYQTRDIQLGHWNYSVGESYLNGLIDEVSTYNRALSSPEIQSIATAGSSGKCHSCTPAPVGLVSWWPGDGNGLDTRGRNNGTLQNGATFAAGKVDQAFSLDGADDDVNVGDLDLPSTFTIDAWIKPVSTVNLQWIVSKDNLNDKRSYFFYLDNTGVLGLYVRNVGGQVTFYETNSAAATVGQWSHVAVAYDGNAAAGQRMRFYVNGQNVGAQISNDAGGAPENNDVDTLIGRDGSIPSFNGLIDEVEIFDRTLTQTEINSIYNADTSGKCKPTAATPPSGMVGWWGGDGDANDLSGNGNNGTPKNGARYAVGEVGQALDLDGVNDYVEVPHSGSIDFGASQPMSFDVWLNRTSTTAYQPIFTKRPDCFVELHYYFAYYEGDNTLLFGSTGAPGNGVSTTADKLPLNTWTHVSVSFDGANATMYINGVPVATHAMTFFPNTAPLAIGGQPTCGHYFGGMIDELTFYNRALTPPEIQSIYNAGLAGKLKQASTLAPGPVIKGRRMMPATGTIGPVYVGDATVNFQGVTLGGVTQEIPLDPSKLTPLPFGYISTGLVYDVATTVGYTGPPTVCFDLPSFTSTEFANLRILHLEAGSWVPTSVGSVYPNLCTGGLTSLSPFAIVTNAPTAANVSVGGRVTRSDGNGISKASVVLTGINGVPRTVLTNPLGYFRFEGVPVGETYVVTVSSKRYSFTPRAVSVSDEITGLEFVALE